MPVMNISSGSILIVEDNPHVRELLEVTLRFKGYQVSGVADGQAALEQIAGDPPALVITDILMPKMDGYSLAYQLRKDRKTASIPIIFISATYLSPEDKAFALSLGAERFIEKPINPEDLLLAVAGVLSKNEATSYEPLEDQRFFLRYRERLETKLQQKMEQIERTGRLLETLPDPQKPAFEGLLREAIATRDEIQAELDQLREMLGKSNQSGKV